LNDNIHIVMCNISSDTLAMVIRSSFDRTFRSNIRSSITNWTPCFGVSCVSS